MVERRPRRGRCASKQSTSQAPTRNLGGYCWRACTARPQGARGAAGQPPGPVRTSAKVRVRLGARFANASPTPLRGWTSSQDRASGRRAGPGLPLLLLLPQPWAGAGISGPAALPVRRPRAEAGAGRPPWAWARPRRRPPGLAPRQAELAGRGLALGPRLPPAAARVRALGPAERTALWARVASAPGQCRAERARGGGRGAPTQPLHEAPSAAGRCPVLGSWAGGGVGAARLLGGGCGGSRKPARARRDPPQPLRPRPLESSCRQPRAPPLPRGPCVAFRTFKRGLEEINLIQKIGKETEEI